VAEPPVGSEADHPQQSPSPPGPGDRSTPPDPIAGLEDAFREWDARAVRLAREKRTFAYVTAIAGPLAVLLLTVQILIRGISPRTQQFLIAGELVLLLLTLLVALCRMGNVDDWVRARVRAEILRRERFLILARVGPYLRKGDPRRAAEHRLQILRNEAEPLQPLLWVEDPAGVPWRDALEDAGPDATAAPDPTCPDRYARERVQGEGEWYLRRSRECGATDRRYERAARIVLALALIVAAVHFARLLGPRVSFWDGLFEVLAITLPPVGMAILSIQSFKQVRRTGYSYLDQSRALNHIAVAFAKLVPASMPSEDRAHWEFRLKRLVLRTEELLANELRQWWISTKS
jgi:hypothetical protein